MDLEQGEQTLSLFASYFQFYTGTSPRILYNLRGRTNGLAGKKTPLQILITGANGFVGGHLIRHLLATTPDHSITGTVYNQTSQNLPDIQTVSIDLTDADATHALIEQVQPDVIYHLAAQSSPALSFKQPWATLEVNIKAQLNVLEACQKLNLKPHTIITSSAEIYGIVKPEAMPLTEDHPLRPTSPYSLSKVTQDLMGLQYFLNYDIPVIRVRAFNHLGPGQNENFVAPAFALQIARIEAGLQQPIIRVGNLEAMRDFTDVRDIVRAYHLLAQHGQAGEAYNVASNTAYSIQQMLDGLLALTPHNIEVQLDPERLRPSDIPIIQGDCSKLRAQTGWEPTLDFEKTLRDVLDDCRQRVNIAQ